MPADLDFIANKLRARFYEAIVSSMSDDEDRSPYIHVSHLVGLCLRKSFFGKKHKMFSLDSLMRMSIGSAVHRIPLFEGDGTMAIKLRYPKDVPVSEAIEANLDYYFNGNLVDLKTTRESHKGPSDYVKKQLRAYRAIGEYHGMQIKHCWVIYFNVDTTEVQVFNVRIKENSAKVLAELMELRNQLAEALAVDVPPPRQIGWWCQRCEAASYCFAKEAADDDHSGHAGAQGGKQSQLVS